MRSLRQFRYCSGSDKILYKEQHSSPPGEHEVSFVAGVAGGALLDPAAHGLKPLADFEVAPMGICSETRKEELDKYFKKYYEASGQLARYNELFVEQNVQGPRTNLI